MTTRPTPSRQQVVHLGQRVPGLFERTTVDGRRRYELRRKIAGRSIRRTLAAATQTDAVREARRLSASLDAGTRLVSRSDLSVAQLVADWQAWANSSASGLAPRTVALYRGKLAEVTRQLGPTTKARAVTTGDVRRLIDRLLARRHSGTSVRHSVNALSSVMRYGVRTGEVDLNPVRGLERGDRPSGKRQTEPRYLDARQVAELLAGLSDEFRPVAACCAFAALRISEALALRWEHVDFDGGVIDVPGTKTAASRRPVPMTAALARELRAHRSREAGRGLARVKPDQLVFQTSRGKPQGRRNALRAVHRAGDTLGLNPEGAQRVGLHDLRHSCAGLLLAAGLPLPKVSAVLRHANVGVTATVYSGLVESQRDELRGDLEAAFA